VLAWDVAANGSLSSPRTFAEMSAGSADGLAVDEEGGVWVATGNARNLARFAPDGRLDHTLDVPAPFVSSLCFGGDDMCDLYITTGDGKLLRDRADIAGIRLPTAQT
jgi:sugar lactone lactonase YvrE